MDTLEYIIEKFNLSIGEKARMPVEIRNFGRDQMAGLFNELGLRVGVEVGVRGGDYSLTLCQAIPAIKLWGIDPYIRIKGYRDITKQATFDEYEAEARKKLTLYVARGQYHFVKELSLEALVHFKDESLDFVYIDGNHDFQNVTNDIAEWSKKVRPGGIISGDDYFKHKGPARIHVYQVVNAYTDAWHIRPWFVAGTKAVVPGEVRDHGRSWFWVKQ